MIKQRDSKQLPRFLEFPGDILILEARLKIPRWMVVADDEITRPDQIAPWKITRGETGAEVAVPIDASENETI